MEFFENNTNTQRNKFPDRVPEKGGFIYSTLVHNINFEVVTNNKVRYVR